MTLNPLPKRRTYWILDGKNPVPEPDALKWAQWFEIHERHVDKTIVQGYEVSTVFLGMDHGHSAEGPPVLFETMIFAEGSRHDLAMWRYCTWDQAARGHAEVVKQIESGEIDLTERESET